MSTPRSRKAWTRSRGLSITVAAALLVAASPALAGTITIVTSFPKDLTQVYKTAFEKQNPDIKVEILNKATAQGIAYVRELPAGQRPDIFWASAPDAFEVMKRDNLLDKASDLANKDVPAKIGNYSINDPGGRYLGQALGGYGLMWNTRYMKANKVPPPAEWADLTKAVYFGHVALSSPSRSGTTHLTVETILQGEGWDKGWSQLLEISGNSAQITERSFGVPDGVNNGQFGVGIVVDFFGLSSRPVTCLLTAASRLFLVKVSRNFGSFTRLSFTIGANARSRACFTRALPSAFGFFDSAASASWIALVAACNSLSRKVTVWSNRLETR